MHRDSPLFREAGRTVSTVTIEFAFDPKFDATSRMRYLSYFHVDASNFLNRPSGLYNSLLRNSSRCHCHRMHMD